jgi:hypothetical protein
LSVYKADAAYTVALRKDEYTFAATYTYPQLRRLYQLLFHQQPLFFTDGFYVIENHIAYIFHSVDFYLDIANEPYTLKLLSVDAFSDHLKQPISIDVDIDINEQLRIGIIGQRIKFYKQVAVDDLLELLRKLEVKDSDISLALENYSSHLGKLLSSPEDTNKVANIIAQTEQLQKVAILLANLQKDQHA